MTAAAAELAGWRTRAACAGLTAVADDWCPPDDLPPDARRRRHAKARRVCAGCPVLLDCAADAILALPKVDEYAMRGGLTPHELQQVAKTLSLPYRREAQHGTRSRYVAGCHDGPDGAACEPCKTAHAEYEHQRRARSGPPRRDDPDRTPRQTVLHALDAADGPLTARGLHRATGMKVRVVRRVLDGLHDAGRVVRRDSARGPLWSPVHPWAAG